MHTHYFFVDFNNDGHYYYVGVRCNDRIVAEGYLQEHSNEVRFHTTTNKKEKHEMGKRKIPGGTIVYCKYSYDKINTFKNVKNKAEPDIRHTFLTREVDQYGYDGEATG